MAQRVDGSSKLPHGEGALPSGPRYVCDYGGEEVSFFRQMSREQARRPDLDHRRNPELTNRYFLTRDKRCLGEIVQANMPLVVEIATSYCKQGVLLTDLIQEGCVAFCRGMEKFDPTRGYKLSTYISWWIRQGVCRALSQQARTVRLPANQGEAARKTFRVAQELGGTLGRAATDEEIADAMRISPERVRRLLELGERAEVPLNEPLVGDDDGRTLADIIPAEGILDPAEALARKNAIECLREEFSALSPRELAVLSLRFALENGERWTLEKIGERFGVSRERIRQIQNAALLKLRARLRLRSAGGAVLRDAGRKRPAKGAHCGAPAPAQCLCR